MERYESVWESVKEELEKEMNYLAYSTYIKNISPIDVSENNLILSINAMFLDIVNNKYALNIKNALTKVTSGAITGFKLLTNVTREEYLKEMESTLPKGNKTPFNPNYTFDNFVVGSSNKFVNAAALSVAQTPGGKFNPLFIYGGSGLGKTHLLHAIANYISSANPNAKILYTTGDIFANELIESIKNGRGEGDVFRAKHRSVDVLLIDDIQFIANKPSVQEEFFHTFNDLYAQNKQIVITSDRQPEEMAHLENRLVTRFKSGLLADVQSPDITTKMAILQKKAQQDNEIISNDVIELIASDSTSDVRTLEGRLKRVIFLAKLENVPITYDFAVETLKFSVNETDKEVLTADTIINTVCKYYSINKEDLIGKKKNKEIVEPRQICMYVINELMSLPLQSIGQIMGGRDHTTVMHARDKILDLMKINTRVSKEINDIKNLVLNK